MSRLRGMVFGCAGVVWAAVALGQMEAGHFRIGASLGGMTFEAMEAEDRTVNTRQFSLSPGGAMRLGYTLTEAWEAGVVAGASRTEIEVEEREERATLWRVGPYLEYNLALDPNRLWYLAPGLIFTWTGADGTVLDSEGFEVGASLWVKRFIGSRASVDFGVTVTYFNGELSSPSRLVYGENLDTDGIRALPQIAISIWP